MARIKPSESPKPSAPAAPGRHFSLRLPHWLAGVFTLGVLLPWAVIAVMWFHRPAAGLASHGDATLSPLTPGAAPGNPGPWGDLEIVPIRIAPLPEFTPEISPLPADWRWAFPGMTGEALRALLTKLAIPPAQMEALLSTAASAPEVGGIAVVPTAEIVRSLPLEARRKIYLKLCQHDVNQDQTNAFRIPVAEFDARLGEMAVPEAVKGLVRETSFGQGRFRFFADLRLALTMLPEVKDRSELVTNLAETSTLLVRLRMGKNSDVRALAGYWGRGGRSKDIEPLLESLTRPPQGQAIDVNLLLPPFARQRIYTYPSFTGDVPGRSHDCHWTALNFFHADPDDRFMESGQVRQTLDANYTRIFGKPMFGDLVLFAKADGMVFHSAVYIADDILFTKNGWRRIAPYVFMRLADVKDFYPSDEPPKVHFLRPNELVGQ